MNEIFSRTELLLGTENVERLATKKVILFGVGGVGSWCAEALVRSGIRHLTMVDFDCVCSSNINRQLMATSQTIGQSKVEVLRERLLQVNPEAEIIAIQDKYCAENREKFHLETFNFIIDAIDLLQDKANLILTATQLPNVTLFSSMGAARKIDPQRIRTAEFWKVKGDPLARALRQHFKRSKQFPARKFQCVYSDEVPLQKSGKGTVVHITAMFGLMLASLVIRACVEEE